MKNPPSIATLTPSTALRYPSFAPHALRISAFEDESTRASRPLSLALLEGAATPGPALQDRLSQMGHQPAVFTRVGDLLAALESRRQFDLLLLPVLPEGAASSSLSAACKALGVPVLLFVQREQWASVPLCNDAFEWSDAIDFDALRTTQEELGLRMRAALQRRDGRAPMQGAHSTCLVFGDFQFSDGICVVVHRGREIALQSRQFELALALFRNLGHVLTRDWLWNSIWKASSERERGRVIDTCAANLRKKLGLHEGNGLVLRSVYKQGYRLVAVNPRMQSLGRSR